MKVNADPWIAKALALAVVFGSLILVENLAPEWATIYVVIIILGVMVYNAPGLALFWSGVQAKMGK